VVERLSVMLDAIGAIVCAGDYHGHHLPFGPAQGRACKHDGSVEIHMSTDAFGMKALDLMHFSKLPAVSGNLSVDFQ
jgi:methyl coenzyme M reductase subunit D